MIVEFFVPGCPRPGGSKRAFPIHTGNFKLNKKGKTQEIVRMIVTDDSRKGKDWRADVINACRGVFPHPPLLCPLRMKTIFYMPYRKQDFRTGKNSDQLKPNAPKFPVSKPDVIKLVRSTEDALTGILWRDDCQVVDSQGIKVYGLTPGALIQVMSIEEDHGEDRRIIHQERQE